MTQQECCKLETFSRTRRLTSAAPSCRVLSVPIGCVMRVLFQDTFSRLEDPFTDTFVQELNNCWWRSGSVVPLLESVRTITIMPGRKALHRHDPRSQYSQNFKERVRSDSLSFDIYKKTKRRDAYPIMWMTAQDRTWSGKIEKTGPDIKHRSNRGWFDDYKQYENTSSAPTAACYHYHSLTITHLLTI